MINENGRDEIRVVTATQTREVIEVTRNNSANNDATPGAKAPAARYARNWLRKFSKDEDGAVVAFSLFVFMVMLIAGGLAIDISRQEMERARLQNTLDSAVLAAAGAPYGTNAKAIVEDYFDKASMSEYLHEIDDDNIGEDDIVTTLNSSKVTASASMELDTYLMHLSGVKKLGAAGASTAEMRIPKLEVALVLDVSGSMTSNSKLTNLKSAGKSFVTSILNGSEPGDTVVSVVPFSWSVTPTTAMFDALAVREDHNYSTCLRFAENDYSHASLATGNSGFSNGNTIDQMLFTSVYGDFDDLSSGWRSCFTDDYMTILPFSISESDLHDKIDSLQGDGNTSGHQGMNWGAALLDPTFRNITDDLILANEVDATMATVPADYDEAETLKVIVMMGDGQNTDSYYFDKNSQYRGSNSDLFEVITQDIEFKYAFRYNKKNKIRYSYDESKCSKNNWECVYEAGGPEESAYYLHDVGDNDYYSIEAEEWLDASEFEDLEDQDNFISKTALDWEKAWGLMSPRYYADITGDWGPWNDFVGSEREDGSIKNGLMLDVCTASKNENVVIYTIGFEISVGGTAETNLKACASSVAHYYRAEGVNINDAFSSIASNVVNLRLTQ